MIADMRNDVQNIFFATPRQKQVMMFSATLPKDIRPVVKKFMHTVGLFIIAHSLTQTAHGSVCG
jgi:ATP-dependent RNA helicase UAP56/SUB2